MSSPEREEVHHIEGVGCSLTSSRDECLVVMGEAETGDVSAMCMGCVVLYVGATLGMGREGGRGGREGKRQGGKDIQDCAIS